MSSGLVDVAVFAGAIGLVYYFTKKDKDPKDPGNGGDLPPPISTNPVPVSSPIPVIPVPVSTPIPTNPIPVSSPIPTKPVPVSSPIPVIPVPVSTPIPTKPVPVSSPIPVIPVPVSSPIRTKPVPVSSPIPLKPITVSSPIPITPAPVSLPIPLGPANPVVSKKPVPPVAGSYECPNSPQLFVVPMGVQGENVYSGYRVSPFDDHATPVKIGSYYYWFRQQMDAAFNAKCGTPK